MSIQATDRADDINGITAEFAGQAAGYRHADLPGPAATVAKQCLLDWLGVTLAGKDEPLVAMLRAEAAAEGGAEQASLIAARGKVTAAQACLVNGSAGHALDYDDVNMAMGGHPSVPVLPVALALAERDRLDGKAVIEGIVAGIETVCRIGRLVAPGHYEAGFHVTGTVGAFGAAATAGRMLGLDAATMATAFGIAGCQAAGLKSMFGTMCKPLHAGKAAANGLLAASLAQRGFTSNPAVLEVDQGFTASQTDTVNPAAARADPEGGFHTPNTLFKYHAACYLTHSMVEAIGEARREHGFKPDEVTGARVEVDRGSFRVCNIPSPSTGLESKFSLRQMAAFALSGVDTARLDTFSDELAVRPDLVRLRENVAIEANENRSRDKRAAHVAISLKDGRVLTAEHNVAIPMRDLDRQWERLSAKFMALAEPIVGQASATRLVELCRALEDQGGVDEIARLSQA
ncbi:MAG: MmgE/PrpD family protein [Alphaproteobacteria bacterium]